MVNETLDKLDKRILSLISQESNISYSDLAEKVDVSRNTVYRRVKDLKELGLIKRDFIKNTTVDISKFEKLDISTLLFAVELDIGSLEKTSEFLENRKEVKLILETLGEYDIIAILVCEKGKERELIYQLREDLHKKDIKLENYSVFLASSLKKLDLTLPF